MAFNELNNTFDIVLITMYGCSSEDNRLKTIAIISSETVVAATASSFTIGLLNLVGIIHGNNSLANSNAR